MEDSLEEVALKQTGDDDEVDDFEDFVFGHFFVCLSCAHLPPCAL